MARLYTFRAAHRLRCAPLVAESVARTRDCIVTHMRRPLAMTVRRFLCLVGVAACVAAAPSQSFAQPADPVKERLDKSPRHHEWVDVESKDGRKVKCFV